MTIAGTLEQPTSGQVFVDGTDVAGLAEDARARLRRRAIGFVFQDFNLLAGLSAVENVALPLELDGTRARAARAAAAEVLEQLGLAGRADQFPDDLSGGERQRVAIARAVVGERRLLLADEPTGALDSTNGELVMRMLRTACQGGLAGIVVTHDAQLASWADRVVFIRDGRIVDQTSPPPRGRSRCSATAPPHERRVPGPRGHGPLVGTHVPAGVAPAATHAHPAHHRRRRGGVRGGLDLQRRPDRRRELRQRHQSAAL